MTDLSLEEQLKNIIPNEYPFVRRDKAVRARLLASFTNKDTGIDMVIVATLVPNGLRVRPKYRVFGANEPRAYNVSRDGTIRVMTTEYWENNYWEGKD